MVWTCHEERRRICWKENHGNGCAREKEQRKTKEEVHGIDSGDMKATDVRTEDATHSERWRRLICYGDP